MEVVAAEEMADISIQKIVPGSFHSHLVAPSVFAVLEYDVAVAVVVAVVVAAAAAAAAAAAEL